LPDRHLVTKQVCAVCGASDLQRHYDRTDDYITGDRFEIWQCPHCQAARTLPVPADLGRYYPSLYRRYRPLIAAILAFLYRRRARHWARLFAAPGSAFEMGCGNGLMLDTLRRWGWQVIGSERTEAAAQIARGQFGLTVLAGGIETLDPDPTFDLILLNQVLEHLEDPSAAVAMLAARLKPGGRLIINVPNFASWQARFGGTGWFHLDPPRHLHHFSLPALTALAGMHGLEIERASYVSPEHDPYGWVQSVLNRFDRRANRLTRLLMRLDPPDAANLLHVALGGLIGIVAPPLSIASWLAGRGALIEIVCRRA
jgi:SAM-dependent methyltransferase